MRRLVPILCLVMVAGCTSNEPTVQAWTRQVWDPAVAAVPEPSEATQEACEAALPELRAAGEELLPAPDPDIANSAETWLGRAESLVFECSSPDTDQDYAEAHAELERLREEVQGLLASGS